jgi:hypothetical protein
MPGPAFYSPNLWPEEIPDIEPAFKELGQLFLHVGTMLTKCVFVQLVCGGWFAGTNPGSESAVAHPRTRV